MKRYQKRAILETMIYSKKFLVDLNRNKMSLKVFISKAFYVDLPFLFRSKLATDGPCCKFTMYILHLLTFVFSKIYMFIHSWKTSSCLKGTDYPKLVFVTYWPCARDDHAANRFFDKLSTIQECQYCQLHFSCAIRKELNQRGSKP